jgi:protein-tyrosine phosphatase
MNMRPASSDLERRRIEFRKVRNLRDLGGYRTSSGGITAWGCVYRSDSLHNLEADELAKFDALGVETIFDLRRKGEAARDPGPRPSANVPIPSRRPFESDPTTLRTASDGERWLFEDYVRMLELGQEGFQRIFDDLAQAQRPALFHCSGGKDRTGLTAALLLMALGVERETILQDYELTDTFCGSEFMRPYVDLFVSRGITRAAAEALVRAPRSAMNDAFTLVDARYGGAERYLEDACGVARSTLDTLRSRLVEH